MLKKAVGFVAIGFAFLGLVSLVFLRGLDAYGVIGVALYAAVGYLGYYFFLRDSSKDKHPY